MNYYLCFEIKIYTMKKSYKILLLSLTLLFTVQYTYSQETDTVVNYTSYELLSSYYNGDDFKPFKKKTGYVGLAFSLHDQQSENNQGFVQDIIDGESLDYTILFKGGYYIADYSMIGFNFIYYQSKFEGLVFQDPDTIQSNTMTRGWGITPNLRTSIPLTANERLSFFVELNLMFGMEYTNSRKTKQVDDITKTYTTEYLFGAGISPGITFFAMEDFAFEVQLNILGYKLDVINSEIDGTEQSQVIKQKVNLDIDLITLQLGLAYYF